MTTHARRRNPVTRSTSAAILLAGLIVGGLGLAQCLGEETAQAVDATVQSAAMARGFDFIAIALTVGMACLGAAYAVAKVGSAALGAVVEKPELMGKALIFVGLAEGIAIYGLIFGILLLKQL